MNKSEMYDHFQSLLSELEELFDNEIRSFWNSQGIDIQKKEEIEVISGLLSRQVTIAIHFIRSPNTWNHDIAPLIIRCLADNIINLSWITKDVENRSKMFIGHGLGQEKLIIEHRKNQLKIDGKNPDEDEMIMAQEKWLSVFRYPMLTDVNLGSWSGLSTRIMAEDAGILDFYNYVYLPFSSSVHNQWNHIAKYNLAQSPNPLHKGLLIPFRNDNLVDLTYLLLVSKYVDMAYEAVYNCDKFIKPPNRVCFHDWLSERLSTFE